MLQRLLIDSTLYEEIVKSIRRRTETANDISLFFANRYRTVRISSTTVQTQTKDWDPHRKIETFINQIEKTDLKINPIHGSNIASHQKKNKKWFEIYRFNRRGKKNLKPIYNGEWEKSYLLALRIKERWDQILIDW